MKKKIKHLTEELNKNSDENKLIAKNRKLCQKIHELEQENQNLQNEFKSTFNDFNKENVLKIAAMGADVSELRNQLMLKEKN